MTLTLSYIVSNRYLEMSDQVPLCLKACLDNKKSELKTVGLLSTDFIRKIN